MIFPPRFIAPALLLATSFAQGQTLSYAWPTLGVDACSEWLDCDNGCSACNTPVSSSAVLVGTAAAWIDIVACAHPISAGDNAIHTTGWGSVPGEQRIVLSLISLVPLRIDSIIIRHASADDGPERLLMTYTRMGPITEGSEADVAIGTSFTNTVICDAGLLQAETGQSFGMGQIILKAYGNGSGPWILDEIRIVTSHENHTGISGYPFLIQSNEYPYFDALGRQFGLSPRAQGVFLRAGRTALIIRQ